jgi:hypothetical protein
MPATCTRIGQIRPVAPGPSGCEECLRSGQKRVHLRLCLARTSIRAKACNPSLLCAARRAQRLVGARNLRYRQPGWRCLQVRR